MNDEHPILFSGPMARAILDGRKTQTRRVMRQKIGKEFRTPGNVDRFDYWPEYGSWQPWHHNDDVDAGELAGADEWFCPYGVPCDRLWVRETFSVAEVRSLEGSRRLMPVYKADFSDDYDMFGISSGRWFPSIHMRREESRITLEVTDVRVQRLQDISEEDSKAEGVQLGVSIDARAEYQVLWNEINSKRGYGWRANPWVWAITFKKV